MAADDTTKEKSSLSDEDHDFLAQALRHAKIGKGHTFPNPAVGCLIVRQDTNEIVGAGFHPKAGYPHAEIFALLEASGHIEDGISAATSVVDGTYESDSKLVKLFQDYTSKNSNGPQDLFGNSLADVPVTAYVTLEPCCHYGKTPPCAASLSLAGVDRVVVGVRDPNPKVDGGGVRVLEDAGIRVDVAEDDLCALLVDSFVKRITPKEYPTDYAHVNGVMRRGLRKLAGQKKNQDSLQQVAWSAFKSEAVTTEEAVDAMDFPPEWMEHLDDLLWREELVNVRLNKVVAKKKLAKQLGNRIADSLGAHVAQVLGHTVLLYRPAMPEPILDLEELVAGEDNEE